MVASDSDSIHGDTHSRDIIHRGNHPYVPDTDVPELLTQSKANVFSVPESEVVSTDWHKPERKLDLMITLNSQRAISTTK